MPLFTPCDTYELQLLPTEVSCAGSEVLMACSLWLTWILPQQNQYSNAAEKRGTNHINTVKRLALLEMAGLFLPVVSLLFDWLCRKNSTLRCIYIKISIGKWINIEGVTKILLLSNNSIVYSGQAVWKLNNAVKSMSEKSTCRVLVSVW